MDDERCPPIAENRVTVVAQRHIRRNHCCLGSAIRTNSEILHIACVRSLRVLQPVMLAVWIEMRTSGSESRGIAFRNLVNVDRVLAGRQILEIQFNVHTMPRTGGDRRQNRSPGAFPLGVLQLDSGGLSGGNTCQQRYSK